MGSWQLGGAGEVTWQHVLVERSTRRLNVETPREGTAFPTTTAEKCVCWR